MHLHYKLVLGLSPPFAEVKAKFSVNLSEPRLGP